MLVKSAWFHRNGVTGGMFYAGIVTDPFKEVNVNSKGRDFLVVIFPRFGADGQPLVEETIRDPDKIAVFALDELARGNVGVGNKWRGDSLDPGLIRVVLAA